MTALQRMIRIYDNMMPREANERFEHSGFFNFGYWDGQTTSQREASETLVERLVGRIAIKGGRILDVACGVGASTEILRKTYAPDMITAINISDAQLAEARDNVPDCTFLHMDAAKLEFPDNHFDVVICVEAAFHFETRETFLREALRVLKPGGSLVLSDILFRDFAALLLNFLHIPRANLVSDIDSYARLMQAAGFDAVEVEDATDLCLRPFCAHVAGWSAAQRKAGRWKLRKAVARSIYLHTIAGGIAAACKTYVLATGRKVA